MAIDDIFPELQLDTYQITSPATDQYNCIAWAASEDDAWWWPDPMHVSFWPANVLREVSIQAFEEAFAALGFVECANPDFEAGFEKVSIYADADGKPTHAARQLPGGTWTSKLGSLEDIEHNTLAQLHGQAYGAVVRHLKRPLPNPQHSQVRA